MTGDCHVRFCEGLGVKFPRATRLVNSPVCLLKTLVGAIFILKTPGFIYGPRINDLPSTIKHVLTKALGLPLPIPWH